MSPGLRQQLLAAMDGIDCDGTNLVTKARRVLDPGADCELGFKLVGFECKPCSVGSYGAPDREGRSSCAPCDKGTFKNRSGETSCSDCLPGYYADGTARTACKPAAEGEAVPNASAHSAERCGIGTYSESEASTTCRDCLERETTLVLGATSPSHCVCVNGHFGDPASGIDCRPCPTGAGELFSQLFP